MKVLLRILWLAALIFLLTLGFERVIWNLIIPVSISVSQLHWLEVVIRLVSLVCSVLFLYLLNPLGGKSK